MNFAWTSGAMVERLGWMLVHSLWIGAAAGGVHAALMTVLRRGSAQARYTAGCVVLGLFFAGVVAAGVRANPTTERSAAWTSGRAGLSPAPAMGAGSEVRSENGLGVATGGMSPESGIPNLGIPPKGGTPNLADYEPSLMVMGWSSLMVVLRGVLREESPTRMV